MPLKRFAEAEAALAAGRRDEGIALIVEQLELDPQAPSSVYRNFSAMLIRHKRYAEAARWGEVAVDLYPRDYDLWNNLGVALRRCERFPEAVKALQRALKLDAKNASAHMNIGNVYNDMRDGPAAVAVWTKLVRQAPANAEHQRSLGRAHLYSGDFPKAEMRFRLATKLKPDLLDAWLDLSAVVSEQAGVDAGIAVIDEGFARLPDFPRLHETKAVMLRRLGRVKDSENYLLDLMERFSDQAWLYYHLSVAVAEWDRNRAHEYMDRAIQLEPENIEYRMGLAESLSRTRTNESEMLERSYKALDGFLDKLGKSAVYLKISTEILTRMGDYDAADALSDFKELGRLYADTGKHTAFLAHLARAKTPEDRFELIEQHRIWGDKILERVEKRPIVSRGRRAPDGKIRIGFMSSDLRAHPVAYFTLPLLEHYDRSRFELYCYSFYLHDEDGLQARIRGMVDVFRWEKETNDRDAAQMIADDQLDMLIELGGSTHMNKLAVMAYKPAPLQASWLGYPHSAGLRTIDHFILDPYVVPPKRELVLEEPLLMPKSWIAMGELAFPERPINPEIPEVRNGFLTFGTANNPYKYSKAMVQTWARVTAGVPNARFLFVRPEGGSPSFRRNIEAIFAAEGVSADRVRFVDVRGAHMPFYNDIDISLDTFPQTGGTTTCESLFMGVPVVTLVGDAVFERLSYSIMSNAGLGDLCAFDREEFLRIALGLAGDAPRRQKMRTELRGILKASPLGQTKQFAQDFYAMIEGAVAKSKVGETA